MALKHNLQQWFPAFAATKRKLAGYVMRRPTWKRNRSSAWARFPNWNLSDQSALQGYICMGVQINVAAGDNAKKQQQQKKYKLSFKYHTGKNPDTYRSFPYVEQRKSPASWRHVRVNIWPKCLFLNILANCLCLEIRTQLSKIVRTCILISSHFFRCVNAEASPRAWDWCEHTLLLPLSRVTNSFKNLRC